MDDDGRNHGDAPYLGFRYGAVRRRLLAVLGVCFVVFFSCRVRGADLQWSFLPTGTDPRADLAKLTPEFDRTDWAVVSFPHSLDKVQPRDNVYGWYVCVLDVPAALTGYDLVLDLGVIDDADATYFNGRRVGAMGSMTDRQASAWNLDRRYRVSSSLVKYGRKNIIAVQVKDFGGTGGLLGRPLVTAALGAADAKWRFQRGEGDASWAAPGFADKPWEEVPIPDVAFKKRVPELEGHAWYRLNFNVPEHLRGKAWVLDIGPVYDACEIYLNGKLLGSAGRLPPEFIPATTARGRALVPGGMLRDTNLLAVHIYWQLSKAPKGADPLLGFASTRAQGGAGLPGFPALDFRAAADVESARAQGPAAMTDLAELCLNSGKFEAAESLIAVLMASKPEAAIGAKALDLQLRLDCMLNNIDAAKAGLRRFCKAYPSAGLSLSTVYPLHHALRRAEASLSDTVRYLGEDRATLGDWRRRYGNYGYILCGWNYEKDLTSTVWPGKPFSKKRRDASAYAVRILPGDDYARSWIGAKRTTDPRVLCVGEGKTLKRRYACWDDHGEVHPFDERGPDLFVDLNIPKGDFVLSFYLLDYDWYNGEHPRILSILLLDRDSGSPLALAPTGRFGEGVYQRFYVKGPRKLTARINKHRSPCAVVSGVFLDRLPAKGKKVTVHGINSHSAISPDCMTHSNLFSRSRGGHATCSSLALGGECWSVRCAGYGFLHLQTSLAVPPGVNAYEKSEKRLNRLRLHVLIKEVSA